jgi:hypothetical protein
MFQRVYLLFYLRALIAGLVVLSLAVLVPGASFCVVKEVFGFPCPACGGTRSVLALSHLSFTDSFAWNPCIWLAAFTFSLMLILRRKHPDNFKTASTSALSVGLISGILRAILYLSGINTLFTHRAF